MAKRKQIGPSKKKDINLPKEDLKGLQEERDRRLVHRSVAPEEKVQNWQLGKDEEGKRMSANVELPHSPYPFKQPATATKELNDSIRRLRQEFPGAGTARFSNVGHQPLMSDALKYAKDDTQREEILKGLRDINDTDLWGTAHLYEHPLTSPNVYINPKLKGLDLDKTVMHELGHRNTPPTRDGVGYWENDPTRPGHKKYTPAAQDVDDAYDRLFGLGTLTAKLPYRKKR